MTNSNIYTEKFFKNPIITLDIFNKLLKNKHIVSQDMYESGEFLFASIVDNKETREILSPIIKDFDLYIKSYEEDYSPCEIGQIGLCAIQAEHAENFENDDKIMWDSASEEFVFYGMLSEFE